MRTVSWRTARHELSLEIENEVTILKDGEEIGRLSIIDVYDAMLEALLESTAEDLSTRRRREEIKLIKMIRLYGHFFA